MTTSPCGLVLIAVNEGLITNVAPDTGGKQVIGIGHDLLAAQAFPNGISFPAAFSLLMIDVGDCEDAVNALGWTLTQNQFDALVDFTFECGAGALQELATHGIDQVVAQLPLWVHARVNGVEVVLPAMAKRRAEEIQLWNAS